MLYHTTFEKAVKSLQKILMQIAPLALSFYLVK